MIKVIKPGRYKIDRYRYTCVHCLCEFEYSSEDIGKIAQEKRQNTSWVFNALAVNQL